MSDSNKNENAARMLNISFNMILLVFFVYLSTIGEYEENKIKKALGSLVGAFGIVEGGVNITAGETILPKGPPILDPIKESVDITAKIRQYIKDQQIEDLVHLYRKQNRLFIDLTDSLMFDSGSTELRAEARDILEVISSPLRQSSLPVIIEGHTDNVPIATDMYPSNWELSTARAVSVLRFMLEKQHLRAERMAARGFGEYRPLAPNDTPENRASNRRVSIILMEEGE